MKVEEELPTGRHDRFDDDWEEQTKGIIAIDNHIHRHQALGDIHNAEECVEISYMMTLEEIFDMAEWTFEREGIDPPFYTRQIPIFWRKKTISLHWFTIGVAFIFLIALLSGANAASVVCLGGVTIMAMVASTFTLAQYEFRKPGECHHCGKTLEHRNPTKIMNIRTMEEKHHSKAGQCDECKWYCERASIWLTILHKRIDLIFQRKYRVSWSRWKDPITGEIYSWKDRNMPKDRDLTYQLNKMEQQARDLLTTVEKIKKRKRRFRLGA
jgi:hypothetical protein